MKLQYDEPLSNFAINFNLRRYSTEDPAYVHIPILTIDDNYTLTLTPAVL